jgi:hypothetical protein
MFFFLLFVCLFLNYYFVQKRNLHFSLTKKAKKNELHTSFHFIITYLSSWYPYIFISPFLVADFTLYLVILLFISCFCTCCRLKILWNGFIVIKKSERKHTYKSRQNKIVDIIIHLSYSDQRELATLYYIGFSFVILILFI